MLKKLLKYDLKYMFSFLGLIYFLGLLFSVLVRVFSLMNSTVVGEVFYQIFQGAMFAMMGNALINAIMRNWLRFSNSVYKDESYLTHTLPVSKKDIYESKFLLAIIDIFTAIIFAIICLFIAYYSKENFIMIKDTLNAYFQAFNISPIIIIVVILLILYVEMLNIVQCGYYGLIEGNKKNKNKKLWCFIKGLIMYTLSQLVIVLIVFVLGLFVKEIGLLFTTNTMPSFDILKGLVFFITFIYIVIIVVLNIICINRLNKGVNVD